MAAERLRHTDSLDWHWPAMLIFVLLANIMPSWLALILAALFWLGMLRVTAPMR